MKKETKNYLLNVFFISWLLFGIFYFDREDTSFAKNWFSYIGFVAFAGYFLYSLNKAAKEQEKNRK
ncbi:hypothetical protein AB4865_09110 [Capnocytophaga sp. ARDL2]|uniref:hypothetical protein n=1 Tax=Capnocytophaga sp. ARDL2 TaxID=3238809 RepID=UPI003555C04A